MKDKIRVITHSGTFHVDELLAVAALELMFNGNPYEVVRSRDPLVWKTGDYLVDVGGEYDPSANKFDHHQKGGAGARQNGVPYSSFGLVWKHYGRAICGDERVMESIDHRLVQPIDLADNGIDVYTPTNGIHPYILHHIVLAFRPTWKEGEIHDVRFTELVTFMRRLLEREIAVERDNLEGGCVVERIYTEAADKRIIMIDGQYPWQKVLAQYPEPLYVVKPKHQSTSWEVECVRDDARSFINRKDLPESWAGMNDGEFARLTGVPDAVFCHNMRYVAVARTKEGALRLAELALAAERGHAAIHSIKVGEVAL